MSDVGGHRQRHRRDAHVRRQRGGAIPAAAPLTSGTFRPTDDDSRRRRPLPGAGASRSADTTLATFNGSNPNGVWSLFVFDDASGDTGVDRWRLVPEHQHGGDRPRPRRVVAEPVDLRPGSDVHGDGDQRRQSGDQGRSRSRRVDHPRHRPRRRQRAGQATFTTDASDRRPPHDHRDLQRDGELPGEQRVSHAGGTPPTSPRR